MPGPPEGVDFRGHGLIQVRGHQNICITPHVLDRFREQVRHLTRRTTGGTLLALVACLNRYLRGWGECFERAQCSEILDRMDQWIARRVRACVAQHWRNTLWRRYPVSACMGHLG